MLFAFILLLLVAGVAMYFAIQHEREKAYSGRQALALALVDGRDESLFRIKGLDVGLRNVQIIGESIHIVLNTKKEDTRFSRVNDIRTCMGRLDEEGWLGFEPLVKSHIQHAVHRSEQLAIALSAEQRSNKHLRAAQRYKKPETIGKYLAYAIAELEQALPLLSDPAMRQSLERQVTQLRAVE